MKKLMAILSVYKITAFCAAFLMLASLSFASISTAKSNAIEIASVEKTKENCFWYQSRAYFSDATLTTQVGTRTWFCDGSVGTGGPVTPYYVDQFCECIVEGE